MTKKNFAIVLALLLIGSVCSWAQVITSTPAVTTNSMGASDGATATGHGSHILHGGCMLCHTPHASVGLTQQPGAGLTDTTGTKAWNATGGTITTAIQGAGVGNPLQGGLYLWLTAIAPFNYTTWDGSTLSTSGLNVNNPAIHTIMCLSCHDGSTTGSSYDLGVSSSGIGSGYGCLVRAKAGSLTLGDSRCAR